MPPEPSADKPALSIPEDGFAVVELDGKSQRLDLYRSYNLLVECATKAREAHPDDAAVPSRQIARLDAVCALLAEAGYGAVSHRVADKFETAIFAAVDGQKKADAGGPTPA